MDQLYLDTEFNGHGGQLLSIALANKTGKHFYGRLPDPVNWHPWVTEHVVPFFDIEPEPTELLRFRLQSYLRVRQPVTIYADWPADFGHLMDLFVGPTFDVSFCPAITMVLLNNSAPVPERPHNALSDAIALMAWHRAALDTSLTI